MRIEKSTTEAPPRDTRGHIITVDSHDSIAQAMLVHDGKIVAIGTNDEIRKLAPKNTRALDLHGLTVTPGLIDTHCHFDETSVLYDITLSEVTSIKDVVDLVKQNIPKFQSVLPADVKISYEFDQSPHVTGHDATARARLWSPGRSPPTNDPAE